MKRETIFCISGLFLALFCLSMLYWNDRALFTGQKFVFTDDQGDEIVCTYYPGTVQAGIILLHGFSSDQSMMKSLTTEYLSMGLHVFTLDFSGHGRSSGGLDFDNAASDRLSKQLLIAKSHFLSLSGLESKEIFFLGHSMGARVALWAETFDPNPIRGVILVGCQVNLIPSTQADFFTGTDDLGLDWVKNLDADSPQTDILLITGSWDDILPPASAEVLLQKLSENQGQNPLYTRDLEIISNIFHNYEPYSPRVINIAKEWVNHRVEVMGVQINKSEIAQARIALWVGFIIGLIAFLVFFASIVGKNPRFSKHSDQEHNSPEITDIRLFLKQKTLLWLESIPILLLLGSLFFLIPVGIPVFNISYVGLIASYGILLFILYRKEKVKGMSGLPNFSFNEKGDTKNFSLALLISLGILTIGSLFMNTGFGYVYLYNIRCFWLVVFTFLSTIGFYIGQEELAWTAQNFPNNPKLQIAMIMINFMPFYLVILLFIALGSLSGMLGALQGLVILMIAVLAGNVIQKILHVSLFTSLCQAFFLQLLILPQGALFNIF